MKRSAELAPLSRDHHVALAHTLRLRRADAATLETTVAVFLAFLLGDGRRHFAAEEAVLLPALPDDAADVGARMVAEHRRIREDAAALGARPDVGAAQALGELLNAHVRFEEGEVFPRLEELPGAGLAAIGRRLEAHEREAARTQSPAGTPSTSITQPAV
jgi:hypothetical protein